MPASQCCQHCQFIIGQCPVACNDKVTIASVLASYTLASVCVAGFVYPERAWMIKTVHQSAPSFRSRGSFTVLPSVKSSLESWYDTSCNPAFVCSTQFKNPQIIPSGMSSVILMLILPFVLRRHSKNLLCSRCQSTAFSIPPFIFVSPWSYLSAVTVPLDRAHI